MHVRRYIRFIGLLFVGLLACPAKLNSQTVAAKTDSIILFRFVPQRLMFYSNPHNDDAILQAATLIERHRDAIAKGDAIVRVQGFCTSFRSEAANLRSAKNRSNQVKSWFITHYGMKEEWYRTSNHATSYKGMDDIVAIMAIVYGKEAAAQPAPAEEKPAPAPALVRTDAPVRPLPAVSWAETPQTPDAMPLVRQPKAYVWREYKTTPWSIKSNLLYDVLLMPSLEFEYYINRRWSVNLEGNMAWWHNDPKHRYYQLATISPEGRFWFKTKGLRHGHYIGAFVGGGWYDLENGGRGYQGEMEYAGISYGYMFPIGKHFSMEAGIGIGYMNTKYDEYLPMDGHYVFQQAKRMNYFGPLKLKLAVGWNIGRWVKKGGTL